MDEIRDGIEDGSLIGTPVYVYSHSGATMRTTPFSCPWDSGQSGFVYVSREDALANWGTGKGTRMTKSCKDKALEGCEIMVKEYDKYLTGDCWGYVIDEAVEDPLRPGEQMLDENDEPMWDENVDSMFGFLGSNWKENGMSDYIQGHIEKGYSVLTQ